MLSRPVPSQESVRVGMGRESMPPATTLALCGGVISR
jgi:hypothetical protein